MGELSERERDGAGKKARQRAPAYQPVLDGLWLDGRRLKPGIILWDYTGRGDETVPRVVEAGDE